MAKKKLFSVDPPTKTVTIPGVSSVIADQFNQLIAERKEDTGQTNAQIFEQIVLNERRKDVGNDMVEYSMKSYNEAQKRFKRLNKQTIEKT